MNQNECVQCKTTYSSVSNLRKHLKKFHSEADVSKLVPLKYNINSEFSNIRCSVCKKTFNHKKSLRRHVKIHDQKDNYNNRLPTKTLKDPKKCSLCNYTGSLRKDLQDHFANVHQIPLHWHNLTFSSFKEFEEWKLKIETETNTKYIKRTQAESFKSHTSICYVCHRSGNFFPKGKGKRTLKTQGSNKINAYCPSHIQLTIKSEGDVKVKYLDSHVGHKLDIGHLQLTQLERKNIASKIAAKIPFDSILDEIRDSITDEKLKRVNLTTKKDLFNIEAAFNLSSSSVRHPNDAISVESWVLEMQRTGESILLYKPQGVILEELPQLRNEDFVLIIMTPAQSEILKKFGSDCICLDGTHGMNAYNFELHTLLVIDDLREGFPCAFLLSNRADTVVTNLFFNEILKRVGIITPNIFMSDLTDIYFHAWLQVMGIPKKRLFCTWHLDRAWRKNLSKIKNQEKKVLIYKELRTLLQERDSMAFERMLQNYCSNMSDPETVDFKRYFKENYQNNSKYWAYCYRLHSGLNTNMHLERMHKTIKYIYLGAKKVKRLDKGIGALLRFVRDKLIDRLTVANKGKISSKLKIIRDRHDKSTKMDNTMVVPTEHGWDIPSEHRSEIYFIQEINSSCKCQLSCSKCNICLHRYYCSCQDSAIQFNMCKHIHLLAKFRSFNEIVNNDVHESPPELCIDDCDGNNESDVILQQLSTKPKRQKAADERQQKLSMQFQDILNYANTDQKLDVVEKVLNSLLPTLEALDHSTMAFPSTKHIVHNEKITPQRKFWSTKKKQKKTKSAIKNPSLQESNTIAVELLFDVDK